MMTEFHPGDRVKTPAGNTGTVQAPKWEMPNHALVQIDGGALLWIRADLLVPSNVPEPYLAPVQRERKTSGRRKKSA